MSRRYGRRQRRRHRERIAELERMVCPHPDPGSHLVLEGFWIDTQERVSGEDGRQSRELDLNGICLNMDPVLDTARDDRLLWYEGRLWAVREILVPTTIGALQSCPNVQISLVEACR